MSHQVIKIGVIIPYYQKKIGILRRALDSILAQNLPSGVSMTVVVVDDASPHPAEPEIEGLDFSGSFHLNLVKQVNGGCAVARNTGLKNLDDSFDYISFLDSDDFWVPDHIAEALKALNEGYDFYFTDHSRVDHHSSLFEDIKFPPTDQPAARTKQWRDTLWEIDPDYFFHYFLHTFTVHISSLLYRRNIFPAARFDDSLRSAGEDYLFMLQILQKAQSVCFNTKAMMTCGDGINIYYGTYNWNSEGPQLRNMGDILSLYKLRDELDLSLEDHAFINKKITMCHRRFAFFTVRRWLKTRTGWSDDLKALAAKDEGLWLWFWPTALFVTIMAPLKLYSPLKDVSE